MPPHTQKLPRLPPHSHAKCLIWRGFPSGIALASLPSDYCVRNPIVSHLTVSYVSQTPPGTAPAGPAAPAVGATDAANPLGFLGALIDQLLAGGDGPDTATPAVAATSAVAPGLFDLPAAAAAPPAPVEALATATTQLDTLAAQLDAGEMPVPADLEKLHQAVAAIATAEPALPEANLAALRDRLDRLAAAAAPTAPAIAAPLQALAAQLPPVTIEHVARDPDLPVIANIIRSLLGQPARPLESGAGPTQPDAESDTADVLRILAASGLDSGVPPTPAASAAADEGGSATVPAPLLRLANQLGAAATALGDGHPELAQKLEAVAARIVATGADPGLPAQLAAAAAGTDSAPLERLVQSLLEARPAATTPPTTPPQLAATELPVPAPIAVKDRKPGAIRPDPAAPAPELSPATRPERPTLVVSRAADPRPGAKDAPDARPAAAVAETARAEAAPGAPAQPATAPPQPVQAQQPRLMPAAYQQAANPINMGQLAFEMVRQVQQGTSRFTIRLDPPELGRVDVRMHVDPSGSVNARLTVDRPETLDLFQRDQRQLERALAQAGLDATRTSLEFSLRQNHQNPFAGFMDGNRQQQHPGAGRAARFTGGNDDIAAAPAVTLYRGIASAGGVNIVA